MPDPKRFSWLIWAVPALFIANPVFSQTSPPKDAAAGKAEQQKAAASAKADESAKDQKKEATKPAEKPSNPTIDLTEVYRDARVDETMSLDLVKELPAPRPVFTPNEEKQLLNIASGRGDLNPRMLNRFVEAKAADLTNKKAIETMISGEGSVSSTVRPLETATVALINASKASNAAGNSPFMAAYSASLIKTLQPLLKAHLFTRVQAAQALAATGSVDVAPLLMNILSDDTQPWQMKLIALDGLNNVIQGGRKPTGFTQRTQWTVALGTLLREEEDAPWFIKSKTAQLMGNLRIVSESVSERKVLPAETMMDFLTDSMQRPEVRMEAARSLGLMDITSQFRPYNFQLVTVSVAEAVAEIATTIATMTPSDSSRAQQLVAIMVDKVAPCFMGVQGLVDSGILQQMSVAQTPQAEQVAINELFKEIKDVINAGTAYARSRGDQIQSQRSTLQGQIAELQKVITKNQPKVRSLVKGGKEFEEKKNSEVPSQVAQGL